MSQVIHVREALDLCARAMEGGLANDFECACINTIFGAAGRLAAAHEIASMRIQADPNMSVPDWLVERYSTTEVSK